MSVFDGDLTTNRAAKFLLYVEHFGAGDVRSRKEVARLMGVPYSTALYNLERAVTEGYLNKRVGYASENHAGWLYALPETMPRLGGV